MLNLIALLFFAQNLVIQPAYWKLETNYKPVPKMQQASEGIYFTFPTADHRNKLIGTLYTNLGNPMISGSLSVTFSVMTTGNVTFNAAGFGPGCMMPANTRIHIRRKNWDRVGYPVGNDYRWWANPTSFQLMPGSVTMTVPLTPDQWSNVNGHFGTFDQPTTQAFYAALNDVQSVGLTFGGGCNFGHGVNVSGGTAQFVLHSFSIQ